VPSGARKRPSEGVVAFVLAHTPLGLALRAVGDNPAAVEAQGISVAGLRIGALAAGSALMALGGAFLTMSAFNAFFFGMINGRGWVCIALTVFASWRPGKALIGALLFGAFASNQKSEIRNQKSEIRNQKSEIRDRHGF
jgi:general nucleoside transport system permease protein